MQNLGFLGRYRVGLGTRMDVTSVTFSQPVAKYLGHHDPNNLPVKNMSSSKAPIKYT